LSNDKDLVLANLDQVHREARRKLGLLDDAFATAKQVHGSEIAVIDSALAADHCFQGCDGLITDQRNVCLGVYVADCCALYLVDRKQRVIALVHSGRRGGSLWARHAGQCARAMGRGASVRGRAGPFSFTQHYEVDFAAEIIRQCRSAGVEEIHDNGICTACHLDIYYSYRAEKGRTGRMLALLGIAKKPL